MKALPPHPTFMGRPILVGDRIRVESDPFRKGGDDGWRTVYEIKIRGLTFDGLAHDVPEIWMASIGRVSTVITLSDVLEHEPKPPFVTAWVGDAIPPRGTQT